MPIVPSGKRRLMKEQQMKFDKDVGPGAEQTEYVADQQDGGQNQGGVSPAAKMQQQMSQKPQQGAGANAPVANSSTVSDALQGRQTGNPKFDAAQVEGQNIKWKEAIFNAMSQLGIDQEVIDIIKNNPKLYHTEWNNTSKTVQGYFYVPGRFDPADVAKVYDGISSKMGYIITKITQDVVKGEYGDKAYQKVQFETKPMQNTGIDPNMDFAEFMTDNKGGNNKGQMAKAAKTQSEMMKDSRGNLLDTLFNIGWKNR